MAPNRGIAAHFAASKPSISRSSRSAKSKNGKDAATSATTLANAGLSEAQNRGGSASASASNLDMVASAAESSTAPARPPTPKKAAVRRQTRTRLRTPDEGEVDRIMAENQSLLQASPSRLPPATTAPSDEPPLSLLGTPPSIPRTSTVRNARLSPLLEPTTTSPISVRTDPDTNKMFLLLPKSPSKTMTATSAQPPSPMKRKLTTPPKSTSPTKTPRTLDGTPRQLITGETETFGTEEEDGLVLTPGRAKGTRVQLGSPSKSPLLAKGGDTPREQALRRIVDEDEDAYITPRSVRQRAKGIPLPPMATQNAAAIFRGAQLPASSSTPGLSQRKVEGQHHAAAAAPGPSSSSGLFGAGLTHTETDDLSTTMTGEELELPVPKHVLSQDLPLPSFYSSLMSLHVALEHALVVHLATAGCSSATLQSTSAQSCSDSDASDTEAFARSSERKRTKVVRLPNLISYTTLRPLVERSGGRRLGPTELKRLASVWVDFQHAHACDKGTEKEEGKGEEEEVRGLGFIISKTRSMDPRTGRRALDWGIGIELEIKRTFRARTPPTEVGFGGVHLQSSPLIASTAAVEGFDESVKGTPKMPTRFTTPPSSPSLERVQAFQSPILLSPSRRKVRAHSPTPTGSPKVRSSVGAAKAREGMSVVALWNNGLEMRKAEVGRRLRERCARFHQLWLDEKGISVPVTASAATVKQKEAEEPATPSRTREQRPGLGLGLGLEGDVEDIADSAGLPPPPREVVTGAGGLLTPSATRSGGRRLGKRIFHIDPAELDARTLSEEEEEEEAGKEGVDVADELAGPVTREEGKRTLIDEVSQTASLRSSKSMPLLRPTAAEGEVPEEGAELRNWHSNFPLNDPRVVKPVPLANLPSLTAPLTTPHRPRSNKEPTLDPLRTPKKPVKFITQPTALLDAVPAASSPHSTAGMSLRDRIAAKEQLRRSASLPSLVPSSSSSSTSTPLTPMQALSQRALVSRLPELSSILFMLFSNGTTLSSTGITRSPTIPMHDLLAKLSKSVNIQLSARECRQALDVLARIAPGFLVVIDPSEGGGGGGKEYVRLGQNPQTGTLWRLNEVRARIAGELNGK